MESVDVKDILKNHKLRVTDGRKEILNYFLQKENALSYKDLEDRFNTLDRVTLYRTLQAFTDKGVLHKIPNESGSVMYGVCFDTCEPEKHIHDHVHFSCEKCGKIECVEMPMPSISIPGYLVKDINLMITGICTACSEN